MEFFIFFLSMLLIGIILIFIAYNYQQGRLNRLKEEYETALQTKDKAKALFAGRKYYEFYASFKHIHIDIEARIANDLSTMTSKVEIDS